jgi:hypothetical protein
VDFLEPIEVNLPNRNCRIEANYYTAGFSDIMIKGGAFYAVWNKDTGLWSKDRGDAIQMIDKELYAYANKYRQDHMSEGIIVSVKNLSKTNSRGIDEFIKWYKNSADDYYKWLDGKIIFKDDKTSKGDYATFKLPYNLEEGEPRNWNKLLDRLYSSDERRKIEYAIGSIIAGKSTELQKFYIFVGDAGTGKSTILKIISNMFDGYVSSINIESIGSGKDFALETLSENPLIAIQDDVELDHITENARLNSIISHETLVINEKHKKQYQAKFRTVIFAGANREVKITDARSGLLRRIIDIEPSGEIFSKDEYDQIMDQIEFEYGKIASQCLKVFNEDPRYYNKYYPVKMIRATNDMYNFVEDCYKDFVDDNDGCSLNDAWIAYKRYCELSDMKYTLNKIKFKLQLKDYFDKFAVDTERNGKRYYNYYTGFKYKKIGVNVNDIDGTHEKTWLTFDAGTKSYLDIFCENCKAQYANDSGVPSRRWDDCNTMLKAIKTNLLHYVLFNDIHHIVIDFDIKDPITGEKSLDLNMKAANKFPPTYAELSKSGQGIHLHYIYLGDPLELQNVYDKDIEIKVFNGNSSLRRKLTQCVNIPIATINSGLPLKDKEDCKVVSDFVVSNEKALRTMIFKNLNKEYHPGTKPSIDYIYKLLEDAYKEGVQYDISDLRPKILAFASSSSNHADYCVGLVSKMHFFQDIDKMEDSSSGNKYEDDTIVFYDVEVFPNLFIICWKKQGIDGVIKMINPTPKEVTELCKKKLVGFNNRRYDNHILYGRMLGYSEEQLFKLSQKLINGEPNATFLNAYNLSYTDIYDFANGDNKMSLKKWEIKLGIHHLELGLPWDQEVDPDMWERVADYCCNDVISTEATFNALQSDYLGRLILADISGLTPNNSTNQHSTKLIFGNNKHPQSEFMYRDLSKPVTEIDPEVRDFLWNAFPEMMSWWSQNTDSLLPYFPGYSFENGKSIYKGVEVGEGGYVEAQPGMYGHVGLFDVASMHPHSAMTECIFGPRYTKIFRDLVLSRIAIKHKDWDALENLFEGKLVKFVEKVKSGEIKAKDLAFALKIVINSIYGLTAAKFDNAFRDPRNKDNIVAKRGALFMVDLAEQVKAKGYTVTHIKTDSIKIPDMTDEIKEFIFEFGKRYGYTFEHEATYDKICLVNDAVYIAKYEEDGEDHEFDLSTGESIKTNWTATGAEFAEPFIFKTMFSKTDLNIKDYAQTKSVTSALYLDMNEDLPDDEHKYVFVGKVGSFLPIKAGKGGGILLRDQKGKMYSAEGAKGYRWLETEVVKNLGMEDDIDISYYVVMMDKAMAHIQEMGNIEWLLDPSPYIKVPNDYPAHGYIDIPQYVDDEAPFDEE